MSLKRKRDRKNDNNEFGTPKKRKKSISSTSLITPRLNDIRLSPSAQKHIDLLMSNRNTINNSHKHNENKKKTNHKHNENNENDEEDSDIDMDAYHDEPNNNNNNKNNNKKPQEYLCGDSIHEGKIEENENNNNILFTPQKQLIKRDSTSDCTETSSVTYSPLNTQQNTMIQTNDEENMEQLGEFVENNIMKENINLLNAKSDEKKKKRKKQLQNSRFWKDINKLDLIVPPPADDLCDRHLVIIYNDDVDEQPEKQKEPDEDIDEDDHDSSESEHEINGLDIDDTCVNNYCDYLLPNTLISSDMKLLLNSMNIFYEYRIIKIANYALSIKSVYFRNLLSKKSLFSEKNCSLIVLHVSIFTVFVFELLIRLLHLNFNEIEAYLKHVENYETLIQMLILTDKYQIKHIDSLIIKRLKYIASRERPNQINNTNNAIHKNNKHIQHIFSTFDTLFDNGGMTLYEVSCLLLIAIGNKKYLCFTLNIKDRIKEIGKYALRKRYKSLSFNEYGIVNLSFLTLPACAINIILKSSEFESWNENDIFLACTQWADFNHNDTINSVEERYNKIYDNIRYHLLDLWFIECIVRNYKAIKCNNKALNKILSVCSKASLLNNTNITNPQSRYKDIHKYVLKQKAMRPLPASVTLYRDHIPVNNNNNEKNWESFIYRNLSEIDKYRRFKQYDEFEISFQKENLLGLSVGNRVTSNYMVWHGIIFALDLVRKGNDGDSNNNRQDYADSVGVFLYCQGIEYTSSHTNHIWIKYSLKTINHDHALQCSDYKMMQLNFQKGNGSKDFFSCDWNHFLNTYFDKNNKIKFKLTFIDAK